MKAIIINNLNDGIDVKNDPSVVSEGGVVDCVGFDLTQEGILKTAQGLADNDIPLSLPSGVIQWMQKVYLGTTLYVLATTTDGLYSDGVLIDADFTGKFKAIGFAGNIYLCNGTYARRFDGTTCYQWGITAPTTSPTISAGTHLYKTIDTFEVTTDWIANGSSCTPSDEAVLIKQGSHSLQVNVAASTRGKTYDTYTPDIDCTVFSDGTASTQKDYFAVWIMSDSLENLDEINFILDIGAGTFLTDTLTYSISIDHSTKEVDAVLLAPTYAGTSNQLYEEVVSTTTTRTASEQEYAQWLYENQYASGGQIYYSYDYYVQRFGHTDTVTTITRTPKTTAVAVEPVLTDQTLSYWTTGRLFKLRTGAWTELRIPKSMFIQSGNPALGWDTLCGVKIEVATNANGAVNVYFDDMRIIGGSDFVGDYWFMYTWGRMDSLDNVVHESSPSRSSQQINIVGPVNFDRHPFVYAARPLSSDAQVNCGIFYAIGGGLSDFWNIYEVADNTTAAGTVYSIGECTAKRILLSKGNEPAPTGTDMVLLYNKIWMIGDPNYPYLVRSSDILSDGTLAPEGWPTRNAYELTGNHGELLHISVLNKQLLVKGKFGEWIMKINDATDYLQVVADQVSDKGLAAANGVISFPSSQIYPSNRGFIESNGQSANFILPEVEPLIDDHISSAVGVSSGLVSYFSYETDSYGTRTAKVDLFRNKPRFTNLNNLLFECLIYDPVVDKVYGIHDGAVYIVDSGYTNVSEPGLELYAYLKSRVYRPGQRVAWTSITFDHNTGGAYLRLEIYVNGTLMNNFPFMSTSRQTGNFRFGPFAGYDFQFIITGNYSSLATIYFPIRIMHNGS